MTNDIRLEGCRPTPLASYLKALGILRLVAEQADPDVKGWWHAERFWIRTKLTRDELEAFFLNEYAPSPIIAPWNGGSGFYYQERKSKEKDPATGKKLRTGARDQATEATRTLDLIANARGDRFEDYKSVIAQARDILKLHSITQAPSDEGKEALVRLLRNSLTDESLYWLDASVAISTDGAKFPPLLGSGGNDGNLEFSSNYMQHLSTLFISTDGTRETSATGLIGNSLFDSPTFDLYEAKIGQFAPGAAGGPNATAGFEPPKSSIRINPWDFVLMLEGALLISGGVVRRFDSQDRSAASFPFTVEATAAGTGVASQAEESKARGEFWAPLWTAPSGISEIRQVFREGRIAQGRRSYRDGMDAALVIATVGADRRIGEFQRFGFLKRRGDAFLAAPRGRHVVRRVPRAELATDLDEGGWLGSVRREARSDHSPARLITAVRSLEDSIFALAAGGDTRQAAQNVIIAVGRIARVCAPSNKLREAVRRPPPPLRRDWIEACGDSAEVRLASALAGLWLDRRAQEGENENDSGRRRAEELPFRSHVAPIVNGRRGHRPEWTKDGSSVDMTWTEGGLVDSLVAVGLRRSMEATRTLAGGAAFSASSGRVAFLSDVAAFLADEVDDKRIGDLTLGFAWIGVRGARRPHALSSDQSPRAPLPLAYAAMKPFFAPPPSRPTGGGETQTARNPVKLPPTLAPLLAAGRLREAFDVAMRRALADALPTPFKAARPSGDARRLLAALVVPISERALMSCQRQAYPSDKTEPDNHERANGHAA